MTDLVDQVKACFEKTREEQDDGRGPLQVVNPNDDELAPGFNSMRGFYQERMFMVARRGYHHFGGAALPSNSDQLLAKTGEFMMPALIATSLTAFSAGVMIGHQEDHTVRMCYFFENLEHLWHDQDFLKAVEDMSKGFGDDAEVYEFFDTYVTGGLNHISHVTGWAHQEDAQKHKVWDVWLLVGTATTAASYLAGYRLGDLWRERDVLDGIELATEGDPGGSEGEV